ncbi:LysE family transporter [Xenorhabdus sp. SGI246]|uniref:LysE family transporter n=1 Tax=Xenorhabdus sp. SGI246 TaxID=3158263 RepID=UPI00349F34BF
MIATLIFVHFLAILSPGPDFFYVMTSSLNNDRKLKSVLGVTFGIIVWSTLSALGLSIIITANKEIMYFITIAGVFYLLYLSLKIFKARKEKIIKTTNISRGFLGGFITNITNPKSIIYFTSILSIYLSGEYQANTYTLLSIIWIESFIWFYFVSMVFSNTKAVDIYNKKKEIIDILISILLAMMAIGAIVFQVRSAV